MVHTRSSSTSSHGSPILDPGKSPLSSSPPTSLPSPTLPLCSLVGDALSSPLPLSLSNNIMDNTNASMTSSINNGGIKVGEQGMLSCPSSLSTSSLPLLPLPLTSFSDSTMHDIAFNNSFVSACTTFNSTATSIVVSHHGDGILQRPLPGTDFGTFIPPATGISGLPITSSSYLSSNFNNTPPLVDRELLAFLQERERASE